jgi:hypothetical protein
MNRQRHVLGQWIPAMLLSASVTFAQPPQSDEARKRESSNPSNETAAAAGERVWRRPLDSRNQFPVSLMFVSLTPDSATSLSRGDTSVDVRFDYSNIIIGRETDDELLYLDLEYLRSEVLIRHGLPWAVEAGVSIPFYVYYGGFLDPFVGGLHEFLGLPNFLRGQTGNGLTRYEFVTGTHAPFLGDDAIKAVGDITVHLKKTLFAGERYALAARSDVKLPVGEPATLSGSGAADAGIGVAFDRVTHRWGLYSNANYHFLGQPDGFRVKNYFSLMVGFDYRVKPRLTAHLQLDHAQAFVESRLSTFEEPPQQVAMGLRWRYSDRFVYEWRFVEDLSDGAPDFTLGFQLGIRWRAKGAPANP